MKKLLPLVLACSLSLASTAIAAPVTSPSFSPNPNIEPEAVELLDKSMWAYAALKGVSMTFSITEAIHPKPITAIVAFSPPDGAKVEIIADGQRRRTIASAGHLSETFRGKTVQTIFPKDTPSIRKVLDSIVPIYRLPLQYLISGENPLTVKTLMKGDMPYIRNSASLLPDNGVLLNLSIAEETNPSTLSLRLYFGKNDMLLRRVEVEVPVMEEKEIVATMKLTQLQINPKFAPDTFKLAPATPPKKPVNGEVKRY